MRSFFIASYSKNIIHGFIFFLVSLTSCDDHLKDVGMEVIDRGTSTGTFKTDTLYAEDIARITSFVDSIPTYNSTRLYLGSVDNYDFRILMRFAFPSDYITDPSGELIHLDSLIIIKARLQLVASDAFGSAGSINAHIHTVQTPWDELDLLWHKFQQGTDYSANPIGTINFSKLNDKDSLDITLNKDTVLQWVKARNDTSTINPKTNNGIIIDFDAGAPFTQQFYSGNNTVFTAGGTTIDFDIVPRIEVEYVYLRDKNGDGDYEDPDDKNYRSTFFVSPVFISGVYNGGYHGYVYRDRNPQALNSITVGGGVPYRSLIRFNTDKLPSDLTINSAVLVLKTDASGNYFRNSSDSINIQAMASTVDTGLWKPGYIEQTTTNSRTDNIRDDTLKLNISSFVQDWATQPNHNNGLVLMNYNIFNGNFNPLYRVRFYNNPSDRDNSPKIIIYYTQSPQ